jgi:hypothetical protein
MIQVNKISKILRVARKIPDNFCPAVGDTGVISAHHQLLLCFATISWHLRLH